jgi:hypothetical protein
VPIKVKPRSGFVDFESAAFRSSVGSIASSKNLDELDNRGCLSDGIFFAKLAKKYLVVHRLVPSTIF